MNTMSRFFAAAFFCTTGAAVAGSLTLRDAYTLPTPALGVPAAGYLVVDNAGKKPDRLLSAESPVAAPVQIHEMKMVDGVMKMRGIGAGLTVPAKGTLALQPGGYHLMLFNPKVPVKAGDKVPVTLHFAKAGAVPVELIAREREAEPAAEPAHDHEHLH